MGFIVGNGGYKELTPKKYLVDTYNELQQDVAIAMERLKKMILILYWVMIIYLP